MHNFLVHAKTKFMKNNKKANLAKNGATPLKNFSPFDHNDPGTPVAIKLTPSPLPHAPVGRYSKSHTATTEYGRDSGDVKILVKPKEKKSKGQGKVNPTTKKAPAPHCPQSSDSYYENTLHSPKFDPNGSYTGTPANKHEKPLQDADDL